MLPGIMHAVPRLKKHAKSHFIETKISGVQRSCDARDDCLIACPLPNSSIEQLRLVVNLTGYTLFVTSQHHFILRCATNV